MFRYRNMCIMCVEARGASRGFGVSPIADDNWHTRASSFRSRSLLPRPPKPLTVLRESLSHSTLAEPPPVSGPTTNPKSPKLLVEVVSGCQLEPVR